METLLENLKKRNYSVQFFKTKQQAVSYLTHQFEDNKSIAWGGSVTLDQIGIKEKINIKKKTVKYFRELTFFVSYC